MPEDLRFGARGRSRRRSARSGLLLAIALLAGCGEEPALFVRAPAVDGSSFLVEWGDHGLVRLEPYSSEQGPLFWPLSSEDNELLWIETSEAAVLAVEPFAKVDGAQAVSLVAAEEVCTDGRRLGEDQRAYPLERFEPSLQRASPADGTFVSVSFDDYPELGRLRTEIEVDGRCGLGSANLRIVPMDGTLSATKYERIVDVGDDRFVLMSQHELVLLRLEAGDTATVLQQIPYRDYSSTGFWNLASFEASEGWVVAVAGASGVLRFRVMPDRLELIDQTPSPKPLIDIDVSEGGEVVAVGHEGTVGTATSATARFVFRPLSVGGLTLERVRFLHAEGRRSVMALDAGTILEGDLFGTGELSESMPTGWSILGMASLAGPTGGELWVSGTRGNTVFHRPAGRDWDDDPYPIPVSEETGCSLVAGDCGWNHLEIVVERFASIDEERFDRRALLAHVSNCDKLPLIMPDLGCATVLSQPSPAPAPSIQDSIQVGRRLFSVGYNGTLFLYDLPP